DLVIVVDDADFLVGQQLLHEIRPQVRMLEEERECGAAMTALPWIGGQQDLALPFRGEQVAIGRDLIRGDLVRVHEEILPGLATEGEPDAVVVEERQRVALPVIGIADLGKDERGLDGGQVAAVGSGPASVTPEARMKSPSVIASLRIRARAVAGAIRSMSRLTSSDLPSTNGRGIEA